MELHIHKKESATPAIWSETNFVEYPFFKLGKKNSSDSEIKIEIDLSEGTALWHVTNPEGLPGILSYEVFTALELELEKTGISSDGALYFSIGDILTTLGWKSRGGADYRAIREAIDKIVDTKITANMTLQDKEKNQRGQYRNFRLLTEFQMSTIEYPDGTTQDISSVRFNSTYMNNRQHGYVSPISVETFFTRLKSPVAKRLYQYLNKRAFFMARRGDLFSVDVIEIGTLMGLKAKFISDIDKTLSKAHEELIGVGFLKSVAIEKGRGKSKVYRYLFSQDFQNQEIAERKQIRFDGTGDSEISQELLKYGIKRDRVEVMVRDSLSQLKLLLRHMKEEKKRGREIRNPAGFIYSFLKNEWQLPDEKTPAVKTYRNVGQIESTPEERGYVRAVPTQDDVDSYRRNLTDQQKSELHKSVLKQIGFDIPSLDESLWIRDDLFDDAGPLNNPFLCSRARISLTGEIANRMS